jgi:tetraacyldisaccharide 4'-kinase
VQNPDRLAATRVAIDELAAQMIVLDDGFQHRRLARELDLVLLDATQPFGFGRVFPRGALREPVSSLRRADAVCLTRSDLVSEAEREAVRERVERVAPEAQWCEAVTRPTGLLGVSGQTAPLDELRGARVLAFCGIGNPTAFARLLAGLGAETTGLVEFADHHRYTRHDIERLERAAEDADLVVCTHKDLVKVGVEGLGGAPLWAVSIEAELTVGGEELAARLRELAAQAPRDDDTVDAMP